MLCDQCYRRATGSWKAHKGFVYDVFWHPQGNIITAGATDAKVHVWDGTSGTALHADEVCLMVAGELLRTLEHASRTGVYSVTSPANDAGTVYGGLADGVVLKWGLDGTAVELRSHTGTVWALDTSTAHNALASGGDDKAVRLWDLTTGCMQPCADLPLTRAGELKWTAVTAAETSGVAFLGDEVIATANENSAAAFSVSTGARTESCGHAADTAAQVPCSACIRPTATACLAWLCRRSSSCRCPSAPRARTNCSAAACRAQQYANQIRLGRRGAAR